MEQRFAYGPAKKAAITTMVTGIALVLGTLFMARGGYQLGRFGSFLSTEASLVVWTLLAAGGAVLAFAGLLMLRTGDGEVVVTPTVISAPRSELSRDIVQINPATVKDIRSISNQYGETTTIVYPEGKVKLIKGHFKDQDGYAHTVNAIRHVVGAAQAVPHTQHQPGQH